jgi:hypothetical protein
MFSTNKRILVDHERLTGNFFRQVNSLSLFQQFFTGFHIWDKLELSEKPTNDELYQAWEKLVAPQKERAAEDLRCINDIGREKGRYWLTAMAEKAGIENYQDDNPAPAGSYALPEGEIPFSSGL